VLLAGCPVIGASASSVLPAERRAGSDGLRDGEFSAAGDRRAASGGGGDSGREVGAGGGGSRGGRGRVRYTQ